MFSKPANPYDEVVAKATDEKQTSENWGILLTVWEKVNEDGEAGARNCVSALQKRLVHRSANVQLFSLTLADALVNNCGPPLHREISGKAFTQALVRLVNDRTAHDEVKKRVLKLIKGWVKEFRGNPDFELMVDTYESLKSQNHRFTSSPPPSPIRPSDDVLRREEEDLQRALAESAALASPVRQSSTTNPTQQKYTPADDNHSSNVNANGRKSTNDYPSTAQRSDSTPYIPSSSSTQAPPPPQQPALDPSRPRRVLALYDLDTSTAGELPFHKGDVITVVECAFEDWWKGELRGEVGIFPTNYVEEIFEPTPEGLRREAEEEAMILAQSARIDRLLSMMRGVEGRRENLAENEELLDLYQQSMALRPKVVKLIEKYNQKQTDLIVINDKFTKAKLTYEQIMDESTRQYNNPQQPQHQQYAAPQGQPPYQQQYDTPQQQSDPYAGWTEQQRRDYEAQWAAYHAQQAQAQQQGGYYAQQPAQGQSQEYYQQQQQQQPHSPQVGPGEVNAQPQFYAPPSHFQDPRLSGNPVDAPPQSFPEQMTVPEISSPFTAPPSALPLPGQVQPPPNVAPPPAEPFWNGQQWILPGPSPPHPSASPQRQTSYGPGPVAEAYAHLPTSAPGAESTYPTNQPLPQAQAPYVSGGIAERMQALSVTASSPPPPQQQTYAPPPLAPVVSPYSAPVTAQQQQFAPPQGPTHSQSFSQGQGQSYADQQGQYP